MDTVSNMCTAISQSLFLFQVTIAEIEAAAATLLYNSGLAAVSAVFLEFLSAGDHVVGT